MSGPSFSPPDAFRTWPVTEARCGNSGVVGAWGWVQLARDWFVQQSDSTGLLIGTGDTIGRAARKLAQAKVKQLLVANRTYAHVQDLAGRHGVVVLPMD